MTPAVALTIAGSDSGGGAGIQADLKTFAALRVFGTSAVTAVTAQNTLGVTAVRAMRPEEVIAQVDAVLADLRPAAVKTGMLADPAIVAAVAQAAAAGRLPKLVVDPVLVSTSGHRLMAEGGVAAYRRLLLPHALVVTPNLPEAALLTGIPLARLRSPEDMQSAAHALCSLGATYAVVKGGHLAGRAAGTGGSGRSSHAGGTGDIGRSPDVVAGPHGVTVLEGAHVPTDNDHGTGCSLSAAVAARLALGAEPLEAIAEAKAYVHRALVGAVDWRLGAGHGPVDHFGWTAPGPSDPPGAR